MGGKPGELSHDVVSRARHRLLLITAPESQRGKWVALGAIAVLTGLIVLLNVTVGTAGVPAMTLVVPVVLGGLLLSPRPLTVVLVIAFGALSAEYVGVGNNVLHASGFVVLGVVAAIAMLLALDRERLSMSVGRGERMLLELRDRLTAQGEPPVLPGGWHHDVALLPAGESGFGGDLLVSALTDGGRLLELALVDVSGKGVDAAGRALMVSGALGGLLGAVPPADFLPAANRFLMRQQWGEGFATAVHLAVDLVTGDFRLANAGHPPAVHLLGDAGRWEPIAPQGTVLGVVAETDFACSEGQLRTHDALLLYTDGVVEVPGRDLAWGIDKLVGAAERLIPRGLEHGARQIIDDVAPTAQDDRAVVLLWRT